MSALPILSELSSKGIRVRVDGTDLLLSPKTSLTPDLTSRIKKEKSALIQSLEAIQRMTGPGWPEIANDPSQLKLFTELLMIVEMREEGSCPDHYTATTECKHCGLVPIWPGCPPQVNGCPWCFNRIGGLPMPVVQQ